MLRCVLRSLFSLLLALPLAAQAPRSDGDGPHVLWEGREAQVLRSRGDLAPEHRAEVERLYETLMALSREEQS